MKFATENDRHRFFRARMRVNRQRRARAELRRLEAAKLMREADVSTPGWRTRIAETLGGNRSTIGRDVVAIVAEAKRQRLGKLERDLAEAEHDYRFVHQIEDARLRWSLANHRERLRAAADNANSLEASS